MNRFWKNIRVGSYILAIVFVISCSQAYTKIESVPTCYKGVELGDELAEVQSKLVSVKQNFEGEINEYFSISETPIIMSEGVLNPSILLKFNKNNELYYFSISYTYNGIVEEDTGREIFNTLIERGVLCLKGESLNGESHTKYAIRKTSFESDGFATFEYVVESK